METKSAFYYRTKLYEHAKKIEDEALKPHQKIGYRLRNVVNELKAVDRLLNQSIRIKQENNITTDAYWSRTRKGILKVESMLNDIKSKMKKLRT